LETTGGEEDKYAGKLSVLWESGQLQTYYNDQNAGEYMGYSGSQTGTYTFTGNGSASIRIGYSYPWNGGSGNPTHYVFTETTISNGLTDQRGNNGSYGTSDVNFGIDIPEINPDNPASVDPTYTVTVNHNCDHWHWSLDSGSDSRVMTGNTADIVVPEGTVTLTVKGVDENHNVLATDTHTFTDDGSPSVTLLSTPHSCGQDWSSNNQEWRMLYQGSIVNSGNDLISGGGAYVWVEGSGFTSSSQVTNALSTLMPTYNLGFNSIGGVDPDDPSQPASVVWSNATITDGKLTGVCIDAGYLAAGDDEDDNNGQLIRKSAIAVGNNGVAYFMPSQPVFEWSGAGDAYNRQAGSLMGFSLTNSNPTSTSQLATMEEVFQHIRDTNSLASSVDFALVITYGNGNYTSE